VPSPITGDPVCPDFTLGPTATKMRGGLRQPVRVTVLDDDDVVTRVLVYGRRTEADPSPRLVLPDANAEYTVEWGQCENERASAPLTGKPRDREAAGYDCGNSPAYKTEKLVTKKGDRTPHTFAFVPPPKPDCWMDEQPPEEAADAGAPDASDDAAALMADADAGAAADAATDAATDTDAAAPTDAGAADAASPADAGKPGDAGAVKTDKKATDKPAEKKAAPPPAPATAPAPTPAPAPAPTM
jgi:hypothetical protein